ncbi:hypothetical protein ACN28S_32385 [Cystobacter fuscus]
MSKYYELMDDRYHPGRWHLRSPVDEKGERIEPWQFFKGKQLDLQGRIRFPVKPVGLALDFCWAARRSPARLDEAHGIHHDLWLRELREVSAPAGDDLLPLG